jgi:hypothetical protein
LYDDAMFKITVFDVYEESRLKTILVSFKVLRPFALCGSCAILQVIVVR